MDFCSDCCIFVNAIWKEDKAKLEVKKEKDIASEAMKDMKGMDMKMADMMGDMKKEIDMKMGNMGGRRMGA